MAKQENGSGSGPLDPTSSPLRRKVKSGCKTCKQRKVKCDESRPACHRCQSTGRICEGYGIWGGGSHTNGPNLSPTSQTYLAKSKSVTIDASQPVLSRPVQLMVLETTEWEYFEWFMHRSATKLPGLFVAHQWTTLLFQASVTEPSVRHAMIALASAHKEEVRGFGSSTQECEDKQTLFTVNQYSKAIKYVQPCFTDCRKISIYVTLISCVLFVSTEFLRGHYTNGLLHLEYGLNLLSEKEAGLGGQESLLTYIDGWLLTMLTRHLVQAKLLGHLEGFQSQNFIGLTPQPESNTFRSIHHARRGLDHLMLRALSIQERSSQLTTTRDEHTNSLLHDQTCLQIDLDIWLQTYNTTMAKISPKLYTLEYFVYGLLHLYYHLTAIIAGTCIDPFNELRFDQYISVFQQIISYCIKTHKIIYPNGERNPKGHRDPEPSSPNSISDLGWIAPLFFTAIKCRNRRARHQALRLLQSSTHKEGIWNAMLAVIVARKVIEFEEDGYYPDMNVVDAFDKLDVPGEDDLAGPPLPVCFRVSGIGIVLPDDKAGRLGLRFCRRGPNGDMQWFEWNYDLRTHQWMNPYVDGFITTTAASDIRYNQSERQPTVVYGRH